MLHPALPIIQKSKQLRVLILGDLMLDEYVWGVVHRISPEAPVPVVSVTGRTAVPGGAANVAANVAALGAAVDVLGLVGTDQEGDYLRHLLTSLSIGCAGIIADQDRPTSTKIRIIAERQQIVRMDREEATPINVTQAERLVEATRKALDSKASPDGLILSDYAKGCLTPDLLKEVIALARSRGIFIVVDPKGKDFRKYRGVNVLTPNRQEAELACGFPIEHEGQLQRAMEVLLDQTDSDGLLITLGKDGMAVGERLQGFASTMALADRSTYWHIPSEAREVYDVTGAGDTVVSTFVLAFLVSRSWELAARVANAAAGIVVGHIGTTTIHRQELLAHFRAVQRSQRRKVRSSKGANSTRMKALRGISV
jgi:D-beta-D-heptose 7-phosphate kinase / D-beta-D-heptose 1-phosphate adenosyltransferase